LTESDTNPDDPDGGIRYRVVDPGEVPDTPDSVAALVGTDYVSGAACARRYAEQFITEVEWATGRRVLHVRPRVSPEGSGSAMVWLGTGTMNAVTEILRERRAGAADAEAGGDGPAPPSDG
jgi:hypothetical protein